MQRYVRNIVNFFELFEKLKYEMDEYGSIYTAMIFRLKDESQIEDFSKFLLKYIRISDTVFSYRDNKILLILEETALRWALVLNENLKERIKHKDKIISLKRDADQLESKIVNGILNYSLDYDRVFKSLSEKNSHLFLKDDVAISRFLMNRSISSSVGFNEENRNKILLDFKELCL